MSASFSSKYFNKEDADPDFGEQRERDLAPGIVNYTESVVSSTVLSSHVNPRVKQIEPAL